jgi:hypothetical protein
MRTDSPPRSIITKFIPKFSPPDRTPFQPDTRTGGTEEKNGCIEQNRGEQGGSAGSHRQAELQRTAQGRATKQTQKTGAEISTGKEYRTGSYDRTAR